MKYNQDEIFRSRRQHFDFWYERFVDEYEELVEKNGVLSAFSVLSEFKNQIEEKLESLKKEVDTFSEKIKSILKPKEEIEPESDLNTLHDEIKLASIVTFSSQTIGDFISGSVDRETLQGRIERYLELTGRSSLVPYKVSLAYKKRYMADLLHHQGKAIEYLIEQVIAEQYPTDISRLRDDQEDEEIERFLHEKKKTTGQNTPEDFFRDIYAILTEIVRNNNKELFRKDGRLYISRAAEYALKKEEYFEKWGRKGEDDQNGYSFVWHQKKFKEIYEALF